MAHGRKEGWTYVPRTPSGIPSFLVSAEQARGGVGGHLVQRKKRKEGKKKKKIPIFPKFKVDVLAKDNIFSFLLRERG